jgi:hypothetical protein
MATEPNVTIKGVGQATHRGELIVGCPRDGDTNYSVTTGVDHSTTDYFPNQPMVGLILTAGSGNIALELVNKGKMTLPFTVSSGTNELVLRGVLIQQIFTSGTTFNGYIFPLF